MAHVARPGWVATLSEGLANPVRLDRWLAVRPGTGARRAAVLILAGEVSPSEGDDPLGPPKGEQGPAFLFVERPTTMRTHAGQIAFPGGAADPGDADLADTALREAAEETGVDRAGIEVLGQLPPAHVAVSGFDVTGVVGWWARRSPVTAVDPREVAAVLVVPVAVLVDPANRARVQHPSGYTGPAFVVDDHLIWGLTAHLLDGVLHLAGWERPWNSNRMIEIPARYLSGRPDRGGPDAH
ncbi:MAG TPA: CoA pyrophosphatase [Propionibacteriaceae bacterium]|nr:CoA pyrophosphatase [Propionibacteriaceae bacterium]